jgi:hypothetical protein
MRIAMSNSTSIANLAAAPGRGSSYGRAVLEIALVFVVFFLHGAWPTPDVNECGYLTKAAHFWNHDAFAHDFFCNTGDAHTMFYFSFGWLTTLGWSLDAVAWVGRIITWLLLAIAWRGLSYRLLPKAWLAVLSAELFVLLTEQAQMAGEWLVGGVEAKGFAWALVLFALHALVSGRWNIAWLLVGAATSLHVIVGGWAAVCLVVVWAVTKRQRPAIATMLPGMVGSALLAAPGLWFMLRLNHGTDWKMLVEANRIQVFERLPHHLYPLAFQVGYVPRQLLLWAIFILLCSVVSATAGEKRLRAFVATAMGLSAVGFVWAWVASTGSITAASVDYGPTVAANILRFYWSRLTDILVPLGVTLIVLQYVGSLPPVRKKTAQWLLIGLLTVSAYDLWNQALHLPWLPESWGPVTSRSDKFMVYDDWRKVCLWIAANTPPDAMFITPRNSNTFKWYTGRSEVATWKDMPQDAKSIVEWWGRVNELFATRSSLADLGGQTFQNKALEDFSGDWETSIRFSLEWSEQRLHDLAKTYGAEYAVVDILPGVPRFAQKPVYENKSYAVYQYGVPHP